ncbi:MAG: hypothetical protein DHS20C18_48610 [Saprospiraceae bacterium]|nr:MAG: hypothetical protein DHS20C18_48610 [Saprospiraceae bacterium]
MDEVKEEESGGVSGVETGVHFKNDKQVRTRILPNRFQKAIVFTGITGVFLLKMEKTMDLLYI